MAGHLVKLAIRKVRSFDELPAAQQAGMLSNDARFQRFAGMRTLKSDIQVTASAAAEFIRVSCGVTSRRDLNTNALAANRFHQLRTDFDAWSGRIPEQR
jgi:hypothetical protein